MAMLTLAEIVPGLVAYLSHEELCSRGFQIVAQRPDRHGHLFLCLQSDRVNSTWVMLSSRGRYGKVIIPSLLKFGHPAWTDKITYVCGDETVITLSNWDAQAASVREPSQVGRRNRIIDEGVEQVAGFIGLDRLVVWAVR